MAKKEVLVSICDRCEREVITPTADLKTKDLLLPNGWITISIKSRTHDLVDMDLCSECGAPVLRAASRGDIRI